MRFNMYFFKISIHIMLLKFGYPAITYIYIYKISLSRYPRNITTFYDKLTELEVNDIFFRDFFFPPTIQLGSQKLVPE